jgi:predicted Zn-ribbon and HTH transcriptional regulator
MAAVIRSRCRNCGAEFRWEVPVRCPLCGAPMLRLIVAEPKPVRHLTEVKKGDS